MKHDDDTLIDLQTKLQFYEDKVQRLKNAIRAYTGDDHHVSSRPTDTSAGPLEGTLAHEIFSILKTKTKPLKVNALIVELEKRKFTPSHQTVVNNLVKMVDAEQIERVQRGYYSILKK